MTGFFLATLLLLLTPGPTNTLLAMAGGSRGISRSMPLILAEISGYMTTIIPVTLFAATLLTDHPIVASALKLGSASWVLYLAIKLWSPAAGLNADEMPDVVTFRRVLVTTVLNPKALIIALVLMPHVAGDVIAAYLLLLSLTVVVVASLWLAAGATLIRTARQRYPMAIQRVAAVMLCVFSTILAGSSLGLI